HQRAPEKLWIPQRMTKFFSGHHPTQAGSVKVVEKPRLRAELFFEDVDALILQHPANIRLWIEQIPKDPRPGWTGFQTRRMLAFTRAMQAEMAFLHHAFRTNPIRQISLHRIDFLRRNFRPFPVKSTRVIRA